MPIFYFYALALASLLQTPSPAEDPVPTNTALLASAPDDSETMAPASGDLATFGGGASVAAPRAPASTALYALGGAAVAGVAIYQLTHDHRHQGRILTPEPATFAFVGLGAAGVMRRRVRRS